METGQTIKPSQILTQNQMQKHLIKITQRKTMSKSPAVLCHKEFSVRLNSVETDANSVTVHHIVGQ
jgi:hypothetical protein